MGGSTSVNGMAYVRGNRVDYDRWAFMGNEGWSYNDVSADSNLNFIKAHFTSETEYHLYLN